MAKIKISGKIYDLRMSLWASDQIEAEYGDIQGAMNKFRKEKSMAMIKKMFVILANAGRKHAGEPMDVTADVLDDCTLGDISEISAAMKKTMDETMKAETVNGGEADDEVADAYAQELEQQEKNGLTGEA